MIFQLNQPFFIFDVESIGLYGDPFAVAGGVFVNGMEYEDSTFCLSCPRDSAQGYDDDRQWVKENVPPIPVTDVNPYWLRESFWEKYIKAKEKYPNLTVAGECIYPVETNFLASCIRQNSRERKWSGAYPFHEISSIMAMAGLDPMTTYDRNVFETAHDPLGDIRLSARLLHKSLNIIHEKFGR